MLIEPEHVARSLSKSRHMQVRRGTSYRRTNRQEMERGRLGQSLRVGWRRKSLAKVFEKLHIMFQLSHHRLHKFGELCGEYNF